MTLPQSILPVLLAIALCCPATGRAVTIKKCDATAAFEIAAAYKVLVENLEGILRRTQGFLFDNHRDELRDKVKRLKPVCADERQHCLNEPCVSGYAHGGPGNQVRICYYNMVNNNLRLCDLVGTLMHEFGHACGLPFSGSKIHNDPNRFPQALQDAVYRLGFAARDECLARLSERDNHILPGSGGSGCDCVASGTLGIGARCCNDTQCASGSCNVDDRCQCTKDSDCGAGRYCAEGFLGIGKNECRSGKAECEACSADDQCRSPAICKGKPAGRCITENSRAIGQTCCKDDQCRSGKCEQEVCACKKDSDCPAGQQCKKPPFGRNRCE